MGVSIFQFIFFRKERRRYEADTKKREEEAKQSEAGTRSADADAESKEFLNFKEQYEFFLDLLKKKDIENFELKSKNFDLEQKIKEDNYRFESLERKIAGLQKVVDIYIFRTKHAETNICLNLECDKRVPELGTYKHKEDERNS